MIKFNCLIHKETGTVINYEDWLEKYKIDMWSFFTEKSKGRQFSYKPKDILFSDDFEIIYDSEFTVDELYSLYNLSGELKGKIEKLILAKKKKTIKYGIEV